MVKRKQKGGVLEREGFPVCNHLASFEVSNADIESFQRVFPIPGDCVINAFQIMRVLDAQAANIMRVATIAGSPWDTEQIELVFLYKLGFNFLFAEITTYPDLVRIVYTILPVNRVVFAGYEADNGQRHVFLIGKQSDGHIVYIDPQTNPAYCMLTNPDGECERFLITRRKWFLLQCSAEELTDAQYARAVDYTTQLALIAQAEPAVLTATPVMPFPSAEAPAWIPPPLPDDDDEL
jgi:hypothetical protein